MVSAPLAAPSWRSRSGPPVTSPPRLPARLTPIVGREDELAELTVALAGERMVTLTGAGGCGKSRLALELAWRASAGPVGSAVWVELASCADADAVLGVVSAALDVLEAAGEDPVDRIVRHLRGRGGTWLVLDNVEHVLGAVAPLVAAVLTGVGHAAVVCTSREPVGVPGEVVWRVPSLRMPPADAPVPPTAADLAGYDAVRLFVDRARRARRGFTLTDANAPAVAQVCTRLDGLPLAIELAAARVRTMPPERIAAQLDDRFRLLGGGLRTSTARQQTLQASMAWSEGLLDDAERAVFRRLGVFAGGFTAEAAESVAGAFRDIDPYTVADTVGRLVDKSLVQFDEDRDRYALLDTIRSYAVQRLLDTGETARARDAHAEWFARWLGRAGGDDHAADVNAWWASRLGIVGRIDPEWANCAAALDWVAPGGDRWLRLIAGLGDYWALRQRADDSARYGMPALRRADPISPRWLPAVVSLQTVRTNAGDAEFAKVRDDALAVARRVGDRRAALRLEVAHHIGMVMLVGPRADLVAALDDLSAQADEVGEWYTVWNATQSTAVMLVVAGRPAEAERRVAHLTSARARLVEAAAALERGDLDRAARLAGDARELIDARSGAAIDRLLLSFCTASAALVTADVAVLDPLAYGDLSPESLPRPFLAGYAMAQGVRALLSGDLRAARSVFQGAQSDLFTSWRALCYQVQIDVAMGDIDEAVAGATALLARLDGVTVPFCEATCDLVLAECERGRDDRAALDRAHRALATAAEHELWLCAVDALEGVGALLVEAGRCRDGARLLSAAEVARERLGYRYRFPHRQAYVADARAVVASDDSWRDGAELTLPAAVELAQRMRGERSRPVVGWDSLTPTERRVVDKVVAGLTNPQIAEVLLMSRATVKTHLVHVYGKLGIATRAELAAAAARRED